MKESTTEKYARCLDNAQRVFWDIDEDVIRFRKLDRNDKYLPDTLSLVDRAGFLSERDQRFMSQVQGRTYAYIFGLVERFINAKVLDLSAEHALSDQVALEALVQFSREELKHQALFRRIEALAEETLPPGYRMMADPNEVAQAVLAQPTWSVLALTCHIEIFTQVHYKESIQEIDACSPLFKDVFKFHWMEEAQHATLDELEWQRHHDSLTPAEVDAGVDGLIGLVGAVDGILKAQAASDAGYFLDHVEGVYSAEQQQGISDIFLAAYRWQYIVSGVQVERFQKALGGKLTDAQMNRVLTALAPLMESVA